MATGRFAACLPNHTWLTTGSLVAVNGSSSVTSHRSLRLQLWLPLLEAWMVVSSSEPRFVSTATFRLTVWRLVFLNWKTIRSVGLVWMRGLGR